MQPTQNQADDAGTPTRWERDKAKKSELVWLIRKAEGNLAYFESKKSTE
jgi:hypothetical protein